MLVTGDEVLRGRVADRNGPHLAAWLDRRGVVVDGIAVRGDDRAGLADAVAAAAGGVDLVIVSGGLGPTHDDVTMEAVADAAGRELVLDEAALELVRAGTGRAAAGAAEGTRRKQAMLPAGASIIPPVGTAPGCVVPVAGAAVVVLPGPPWELQAMWEAAAREDPLVAGVLARADAWRELIVRVHAMPESELVGVLDGAPGRAALRIGICARDAELEVALRGDPGAADALVAHLADALGDRLFSRDGSTVDHIVAEALKEAGQTVSVAESCTGGGLGARLTNAGGASAFMLGGIISYANEVKTGVLGVDPAILERHGAVSAECARAMAEGARRVTGSDWALSVTGIAGPGGGGPGKPVGLVHIGLAGPAGVISEEHRFRGDRAEVRRRSAAVAMHMLRIAVRGR